MGGQVWVISQELWAPGSAPAGGERLSLEKRFAGS